MDYKKCINIVSNTLNDLNLEYQKVTESDYTLFSAYIDLKDYAHEINFNTVVYDNGDVVLDFIFDKVKTNLNLFKLINKFNAETEILKMYISKKGYLVFDYKSVITDETNIETLIKTILFELTKDELETILREIVASIHWEPSL